MKTLFFGSKDFFLIVIFFRLFYRRLRLKIKKIDKTTNGSSFNQVC
jgi:hypothetical protein